MDGAIDSVRRGGSWVAADGYGIQREEIFQHPIGMKIGSVEKRGSLPRTEAKQIRSANGELTWDTAARRMLVSTPRSAGVVGALRAGETIELGDVKITAGATMQSWATINATVMDGDGFKTARRLLITATGYAENTDMHWKDAEHTSVGHDWGKAPSRVEGIAAAIVFPFSSKAKAWALDERGQRKAEVPIHIADGKAQIEISPGHQTLWWEVAAQ